MLVEADVMQVTLVHDLVALAEVVPEVDLVVLVQLQQLIQEAVEVVLLEMAEQEEVV